MTAVVNGVALSYTDVGVGTPLLCLHGGMGIDSASLRVPGILRLVDRGARLLIPDQRGHGASASEDPAHYSHAAWVDDARGLLAHLGITRSALLGHSYGGFLALEFALCWPDLLTHLVLVGTSAGPVAAPATAVGSNEELREGFRAMWPRYFSGADKHWPLFDTLVFSAPAFNAAFTSELPRYDVRARVGSIRIPALLVVGADDWYRRDMEWLADQMPDATLCALDGAGHFPFVEAEDRFVDVVAGFLRLEHR